LKTTKAVLKLQVCRLDYATYNAKFVAAIVQ